jgi:hypothetical protein
MSVMGGLLSGSASLRGRAVFELIVHPFGYRDAARFWGITDPKLAVLVHSVVGGTPAYRRELLREDAPADLADFDAWVIRSVLNPQTPLFREARYLLAEETEIRDPSLYHSVLAAVAEGNNTSGGIASYIGRKSNEVAHPLRVLADSRLLIKEPDLFRSGRARYRIAEPLITFYQAIMSRDWARLELGGGSAVWSGARARFLSEVTGPHFEAICRDYAIAADPAVFGGPPGQVGSGVVVDPANRTQIQIDVAILAPAEPGRPRTILSLGEVKWDRRRLRPSTASQPTPRYPPCRRGSALRARVTAARLSVDHARELVLRLADDVTQLVVTAREAPAGQPPDHRAGRRCHRQPASPALRLMCLPVHDDKPVPADEGPDAALGRDRFVPGRERARLTGPGEPHREYPRELRQHAVERCGRRLPVASSQQQQAAGPQRADQPVEDKIGVHDPVQQHGALHEIEGTRRQRHQPELGQRRRAQLRAAFGCRARGRAVVIDPGHHQVRPAGSDRGQVELRTGRGAARLEDADRAPPVLGRVLDGEPGERLRGRASPGSPGSAYCRHCRPVLALGARAGRHDVEAWRIVCARHEDLA